MKNSSAFRLFYLLPCALLLSFASCSPGGDPAIIGKWKVKDSNHTIEIRKNGEWVESVDKSYEVTGAKWEWDDTNHIRLTFDSKLVGKASGRMKVTLNSDTLALKDEDGTTEYIRVK